MKRFLTTLLLACCPQLAAAAPPAVATDILPVHSLVAMVMGDLGTPALILPPGASPHSHALAPSQARALQDADLVVSIGDALTPWFQSAVDRLAPDAVRVELIALDGTTLLPVREGVAFGPVPHDQVDHAHEEQDAMQAGHAHGADGIDPHVWLDPQNAMLWLERLAGIFAATDPEHAALYRANAAQAKAELAILSARIAEELAPLRGRPFLVFHDAYHYFEHRFGIEAAGAITLSDDAAPGAARIDGLRDLVAQREIACIFAEPDSMPRLIATVTDGSDIRHGELDPLGAALEPGPALYPGLLTAMSRNMVACLG